LIPAKVAKSSRYYHIPSTADKSVSSLSNGRNKCAGVYNIAVNANRHLPLQQKHITPSGAKIACKTPMVATIIKTQAPVDYTV